MLKNSKWKFKIVVFVGTILKNIRWFWLMVLHLALVEEWKNIMKKREILQLALQLNFWIVMTTCNSLYFYVVSVIGEVEWVVRLATQYIYMIQFNYSFVKTIHFELLCNSTTTTVITSCWHYYFHLSIKIWQVAIWIFLDSKIIFFLKYLSPSSTMIVNDGLKL
jgi:hypothetical protein